MTRLDAIEHAIRAISRRVLGADHSIRELACLDVKHDEQPQAHVVLNGADGDSRIEALEEFARAAAEKVNKIEADYHAARQDVAALAAKLEAILKAPHEFNLAPMAHYHDTKGVKAA